MPPSLCLSLRWHRWLVPKWRASVRVRHLPHSTQEADAVKARRCIGWRTGIEKARLRFPATEDEEFRTDVGVGTGCAHGRFHDVDAAACGLPREAHAVISQSD